jgi:hypothetical protein
MILNTLLALFGRKLPTTYFIKKGRHSCSQAAVRKAYMTDDSMHFSVVFDFSAAYLTTDPVNQWDINKLWGFSEGIDPLKSSARIGWNYRDGMLFLRPFTHKDGEQMIDPPEIEIEFNKHIPCSIRIVGSSYLYEINGYQFIAPRSQNAGDWKFQLFPYFGGSEAAKHNVTIRIFPYK